MSARGAFKAIGFALTTFALVIFMITTLQRWFISPSHTGSAPAEVGAKIRLELLDCGHNDCPVRWDRVERFLRNQKLWPD